MVFIRNSGYVLLSLIYLGLSQLPEVQSGRVRTFSGSIFAQESKSEVDVRKKNAALRTKTLFKTLYLTLVPVVQSGCVRTFFSGIFSQESKSEVDVRKKTRHCALRHI